MLAKDVQPLFIAYADFIFSPEGQFYIVVGDDEGVVRLHEYDPNGECNAFVRLKLVADPEWKRRS